jgi:hypothetical protein
MNVAPAKSMSLLEKFTMNSIAAKNLYLSLAVVTERVVINVVLRVPTSNGESMHNRYKVVFLQIEIVISLRQGIVAEQ